MLLRIKNFMIAYHKSLSLIAICWAVLSCFAMFQLRIPSSKHANEFEKWPILYCIRLASRDSIAWHVGRNVSLKANAWYRHGLELEFHYGMGNFSSTSGLELYMMAIMSYLFVPGAFGANLHQILHTKSHTFEHGRVQSFYFCAREKTY